MIKNILITILVIALPNAIFCQTWTQCKSLDGGKINDLLEINDGLLAATKGGIYKSTDSAKTWIFSSNGIAEKKRKNTNLPNSLTIIKLGKYKNKPIALDDAGFLYISNDNGSTWDTTNNGVRISTFEVLNDSVFYFFNHSFFQDDTLQYFNKYFSDIKQVKNIPLQRLNSFYYPATLSSYKDTLYLAYWDSVVYFKHNVNSFSKLKIPTGFNGNSTLCFKIVASENNSFICCSNTSVYGYVFKFQYGAWKRIKVESDFDIFNRVLFTRKGMILNLTDYQYISQSFYYSEDFANFKKINYHITNSYNSAISYGNNIILGNDLGIYKFKSIKDTLPTTHNKGIYNRTFSSIVDYNGKLILADPLNGVFSNKNTIEAPWKFENSLQIGQLGVSKDVLYSNGDAYFTFFTSPNAGKDWHYRDNFAPGSSYYNHIRRFIGMLDGSTYIKSIENDTSNAVEKNKHPYKVYFTADTGKNYTEITQNLPTNMNRVNKICGSTNRILVWGYLQNNNSTSSNDFSIQITKDKGNSWKEFTNELKNKNVLSVSGIFYYNNMFYLYCRTNLSYSIITIDVSDNIKVLANNVPRVDNHDIFDDNLGFKIENSNLYISGFSKIIYNNINCTNTWKSLNIPTSPSDLEINDNLFVKNDTVYMLTEANGLYYAKLSPLSNVYYQAKESNEIQIFPNPNKGSFTILSTQKERCILYNQLGQEVKTIDMNDNSVYITDLPAGTYYLKSNNNITSKIVVQ